MNQIRRKLNENRMDGGLSFKRDHGNALYTVGYPFSVLYELLGLDLGNASKGIDTFNFH